MPPSAPAATPAPAAVPAPASAPARRAPRLASLLVLLLLLCLAALAAAPRQLLSRAARRLAWAPRALARGASASSSAVALAGAPANARGPRPRRPFFRDVVRIHALQHGTDKGPLYHPHFSHNLFPPDGAFPVWLVADAFLVCETRTLTLVSRHYVRRNDINHSLIELHVTDPRDGVRRRLEAQSWDIHFNYETSALGSFAYDGGSACAPTASAPAPRRPARAGGSAASATTALSVPEEQPFVLVDVAYEGLVNATWRVVRSPSPPPSKWALVAVFSFSRFLLPIFFDYWRALGVDTFYFFYNGPASDIPTLLDEFRDVRSSVTIVAWPILHWILTDNADITHGQPMAINAALRRWRHLHQWMLFYDTDEFLVLPQHHGLDDFTAQVARRDGPISLLRSSCSWGYLNLEGADVASIVNATLLHLATQPIVRGRASGREKYMLNLSAVEALGIRNINIHGIYSHQRADNPAHARGLREDDVQLPAFHLHLLNEVDESRKRDSREVFLPLDKRFNDTIIGDFIRRALVDAAAAAAAAAGSGRLRNGHIRRHT